MKGLKKPSIYKVETLNHIIIYNVMFSSLSSLSPLLHDEQCIGVDIVSQNELQL